MPLYFQVYQKLVTVGARARQRPRKEAGRRVLLPLIKQRKDERGGDAALNLWGMHNLGNLAEIGKYWGWLRSVISERATINKKFLTKDPQTILNIQLVDQ